MNNPYQPPQTSLLTPGKAHPMTMKDLLFSFEGRIPRRKYWLATALSVAILLIPFSIVMALDSTAALVTIVGLSLPLVYIGFAVGAKRWHDRNKSGWWNCIGFIPYAGSLWVFIECGCLRGTQGPNNYGADPT